MAWSRPSEHTCATARTGSSFGEAPTGPATSVADMITSLGISQIFVLDQDQALDFYVGKLGLEVSTTSTSAPCAGSPSGCPARTGRSCSSGRARRGTTRPTRTPSARWSRKGAAGGHLFFYTDDAYATHADLKAKGVELAEEPTEQGYGIDFGFRDPFGNHIRIAQRLQHARGLTALAGGVSERRRTAASTTWRSSPRTASRSGLVGVDARRPGPGRPGQELRRPPARRSPARRAGRPGPGASGPG